VKSAKNAARLFIRNAQFEMQFAHKITQFTQNAAQRLKLWYTPFVMARGRSAHAKK
jgi:hypothetical protein